MHPQVWDGVQWKFTVASLHFDEKLLQIVFMVPLHIFLCLGLFSIMVQSRGVDNMDSGDASPSKPNDYQSGPIKNFDLPSSKIDNVLLMSP